MVGHIKLFCFTSGGWDSKGGKQKDDLKKRKEKKRKMEKKCVNNK
jgi:hypothetical protein